MGNLTAGAHGRLFHPRGPERRGALTSVVATPRSNVVGYASAAFLTALITVLLIVGQQIFKPLVIAILVCALLAGVTDISWAANLVIGVVILAIGVLGVWMLDKRRPVA